MPVMQTMPPSTAHFNESFSVVVPTSSSTLSNLFPFTLSATFPSSTMTSWTPLLRISSAVAGLELRVVPATKQPWLRAIAAAANPTDVVPPRTSRRSAGCNFSALNRDPYAVCSISGAAPMTAQSTGLAVVVNSCVFAALGHVYSAYPPSKSRPMPAMADATLSPGWNLPDGHFSTTPAASMPSTRGNRTFGLCPWRVNISDRLSPKALTRISTSSAAGVGIGRCSSLSTSGPPASWITTAFMDMVRGSSGGGGV
jgi:hypothetical protein